MTDEEDRTPWSRVSVVVRPPVAGDEALSALARSLPATDGLRKIDSQRGLIRSTCPLGAAQDPEEKLAWACDEAARLVGALSGLNDKPEIYIRFGLRVISQASLAIASQRLAALGQAGVDLLLDLYDE